MEQNFLSTLLARGQRGELASGKFKEELGAHVAELAGQIQDVDANFASAVALIGVDPKLARLAMNTPPGLYLIHFAN